MKINCKYGVLTGALLLGSLTFQSAHAAPKMMSKMEMPPSMMELKMAGDTLKPKLDANLDTLFMMHAAQGNMAEVMVGQLALKKSKNAGVRKVAHTIIMGHGAAQKDLAMHFKAMNMSLPPKPAISDVATYEKLSKLKGAAFDKAFMDAQVGAHETTIVLFEHEIMQGMQPTLVTFAKNKLPDIVGHTALIYTVASMVGVPGIVMRPPVVIQTAKDATMNMKM